MFKSFLNYFNESKSQKENNGIDDHLMVISGLLVETASVDGTIDDTTKIYSMAGSEEQIPSMTTEEIVNLIKQVKREPVERDTLYNTINEY